MSSQLPPGYEHSPLAPLSQDSPASCPSICSSNKKMEKQGLKKLESSKTSEFWNLMDCCCSIVARCVCNLFPAFVKHMCLFILEIYNDQNTEKKWFRLLKCFYPVPKVYLITEKWLKTSLFKSWRDDSHRNCRTNTCTLLLFTRLKWILHGHDIIFKPLLHYNRY